MTERTICPTHNEPCTVPTYKGKFECPVCIAEVHKRLDRYLGKSK